MASPSHWVAAQAPLQLEDLQIGEPGFCSQKPPSSVPSPGSVSVSVVVVVCGGPPGGVLTVVVVVVVVVLQEPGPEQFVTLFSVTVVATVVPSGSVVFVVPVSVPVP
jgi:hypothetical protein